MARKIVAPSAGKAKTSAPKPNNGGGLNLGSTVLPGRGQTVGQLATPRPTSSAKRSTTNNYAASSGGVFPGGGSGGLMGGGAPAPAVAAPSDEDYLAGDAGYQAQFSALQGALQRYLADAAFQKSNYETDYGKSLRDLGYDEGSKAWNWNDKLTASGRGYQNQLDDFGNRGMLQSSGYADAYQELQRMLSQQYDAMAGAKNTFMTDLENQQANYKAENTANTQAARAEALQRRAAQYAL